MNDQPDDVAQAARQKSQRALRTARLNLEDDDADGAVNRTYYAAFYLASAALELVGERPGTHSGALDRFWVRFVKNGSFSREKAQWLRKAFDARQRADYNFISVHDTAAASDLLNDVEAFCEAAETLLDELSEAEENGPS